MISLSYGFENFPYYSPGSTLQLSNPNSYVAYQNAPIISKTNL